ncbi:Lsr2 family protein [Streptomyces sp. NPDC057686]|uniref:histone-like nucleoid-structuring protein Lsr2 n=1 Tax=Streptomyces sp. NPDC057686 TaxID=3346212 RepID=UPI0036795180
MAHKIVTIFTDDLTGQDSSDASTHTFSVNGLAYEIDLSPDSYDKLLEAMGPFIAAARKTGRTLKAPDRRKKTQANRTAMVRAWARENGYEVNARGRVPAEINKAYDDR